MPKRISYRFAGVDIAKNNRIKKRIGLLVRKTFNSRVLTDIGHFGGFYDIARTAYREPVLVSSMDGVGTKIKIAVMMKQHQSIGEDLVNHSVNDILCCGARPLFFLDYIAYSRVPEGTIETVIAGLAEGCRKNSCALIGGETAQMPDIYEPGDYDLAGAIVGIVDRTNIIDGRTVRAGDSLIALPSSGLHTNGYSLARKTLLPHFSLRRRMPVLGESLGQALLHIHRSYLKPVTQLMEQVNIKAIAHITGGGIFENTRRVIPRGLDIHIDWQSWQRPMIFDLIQTTGRVSEADMVRSMNLGVGMILAVHPKDVDETLTILRKQKEKAWVIGEVIRKQ